MASGSKSPSTARSEVAVRIGSDCGREIRLMPIVD